MRLSISQFRRWIFRMPWVAVLFLVGCDYKSRQSTFDPKGPIAQEQLDLFMVTVWVVCFLFVAVGSVLLYAVIRFREKKTDSPNFKPKQSHGNPVVEMGLIVVSILMLVIIAIPTLQAIWFTHDLPEDESNHLGQWYDGEISEESEEEVLTVYVYGWQWWWSFEYPQLGITTANEFAMPVGKVVNFELRSRDVIHSFWLPKLAGKVDTIPGRINSMWMQGDEVGHYYGQCAEFCGESHAYMLFRADVLSEEDFEAWVVEQKAGAASPDGGEDWSGFKESLASYRKDPAIAEEWDDVFEGAALFYSKGKCNTCHAVGGSGLAMGVLAPDLTHVADRVSLGAGWLDHRAEDEGEIDPELQLENFYRWVRESEKIKPGNLMYEGTGGMTGLKDIELTDDEVRKIAIYLQSLK
ncbi:MAG: cytochrome c oxidase subunit II [Opitutales bacterium]|nr:cytochrome c oxidase subunit II [Opitutales bacterium]